MGVQSLDRTFDILELLAGYRNGLGVTEIGRRLELHKSTVSRLLHSLEGRGYAERDSATGMYRLGLKLIELTGAQLDNLELRIEAKQAMHELARESGYTVFLAIRRGTDAVYIDKTERFDSLRRYSIIGTTVPLYCSALGKALLLELDADAVREALRGVRMARRTEHTITDVDALLGELERARERGYTVDRGENEEGVSCVGAPVRDYRGSTIAAVSVSGYSRSLAAEEFANVGTRVTAAAGEISRRLGYARRNVEYDQGGGFYATG